MMTNLASRWKRLGGALIDVLISMSIMVPIMSVTGVYNKMFNKEEISVKQQLLLVILSFVIFLIFHGYLLFKRGQTIGKVVVKTKIVNANREVPDFSKMLVFRYLIFYIIPYIPFIGTLIGIANILFIFGKNRRCLHDYTAGTWVINA